MLFPTVTFAAFFLVVLVGAWSLASRPVARKCFLVAASGVFYGWWDAWFVGLLAGMIVASWAFARMIGATAGRRRRALLVAGILVDLAALGFFKYYGFFVDAVAGGLADLGVNVQPPVLDIVLPVGISFYTFEAVSYLVDVQRGRMRPAGLLDVATWLSFFPMLTSGPITRATEFVPQLQAPPDTRHLDTSRAYWLIARGLVKKLVVASFLGTAITDGVFGDPTGYNSAVLLLGVYAYAAQIYADFSGYTDMAIGLASLLGFRLPENFNRPYAATSVQDFWARWHMTLSRWLRDYLFAPITGRRGERRWKVYVGIVGVMLIAGLWHGAAWGFVVFGGVHGVAMAVERWRRERRRAAGRPPAPRTWRRQLVGRVVTFHIVCIGWVFFASSSIGSAADLFTGIATNWTKPVTSVTPLLLMTVAGVIALQYLPGGIGKRLAAAAARARLSVQAAGFAAALVVILALGPTTVPAFIYYRF